MDINSKGNKRSYQVENIGHSFIITQVHKHYTLIYFHVKSEASITNIVVALNKYRKKYAYQFQNKPTVTSFLLSCYTAPQVQTSC